MVHTHIQYGMDMIVVQRIEDGFPVSPGFDQLGRFEYAQLMRYRGLCQPQQIGDIANAKFTFVQGIQDADTGGISEYFEKFRKIIKLFFLGHLSQNGFDGILVYAEKFTFFDCFLFFHGDPPFRIEHMNNYSYASI